VGYGDLTPQTDVERIYIINLAVIIAGIFGYTIN